MKVFIIIVRLLSMAALICNSIFWQSSQVVVFSSAVFLLINALYFNSRTHDRRLRRMMFGTQCLWLSFAADMAIVALGVWTFTGPGFDFETFRFGPLIWLLLIAIVFLLVGYFVVLVAANRLRLVWRVLLIFAWWVPIFNIFLFAKVLSLVQKEYEFEMKHIEVMQIHAENGDCETRYPLLLVHGIFFRDWQLVNYWGRIPRELSRCGARIYYGGQQSAAPIAESAQELCETIHKVIRSSGCEKVNIIAHSKGGLDCRYAISRLGMAPYVASLTTINTPHRGCVWAGALLEKLPRHIVNRIADKYNGIFTSLGDKSPDFLGGVRDLTSEAAESFNAETPDAPETYYQSAMSLMSRASSAPFPLNLGYRLVMKYDKEVNDGLVSVSSALWGNFLGIVKTKQKRGVSHGDMVDLFREDIDEFDVSVYYANLVRELKHKGY